MVEIEDEGWNFDTEYHGNFSFNKTMSDISVMMGTLCQISYDLALIK